jgi:hypothetical protein
MRHALIELELDFRRQPKTQRATDARAEMARYAGESVERSGSLGVAAEDAHKDFRVSQIACDVDTGDGHEADDAWILYALGEKIRHFFTNRCCDSVRATGIVRHVSLNPYARTRCIAHGIAQRSGVHAAWFTSEPDRGREGKDARPRGA